MNNEYIIERERAKRTKRSNELADRIRRLREKQDEILLGLLDALDDETRKKILTESDRIDEHIKKLSLERSNLLDSLLNSTQEEVFMNEYIEDEFILEINELKNKIKNLEEDLENLEEDLKEKEELIKYYEKKDYVKIYDFYIDYKNQQQRYDFNDVDYQMKNIDDITKIFGMTMTDIEGFSSLTEEDQVIFSEGILRFINGWGLGNRVRNLPTKVWKEGNEFRFNTLGSKRTEFMDNEGYML